MGKSRRNEGIVYFDGAWHHGNPKVVGAASNAVWMASTVFDGARSFDGVAPDLGRHCERVLRSAEVMGLSPSVTAAEIEALAWEGIDRFPAETALYICPMFYAERGFISPDPDSTVFTLIIRESPLPPPDGFSACRSPFRRPDADMAPTGAKAACLYPNVARALRDARDKGFDTAVMSDPEGLVAEFAYANLFVAEDGIVRTPVPNGTFLNGITRQRVITLLLEAGIEIVEGNLYFEDLEDADEIFGTGNYYKVAPCTRFGDRELTPGPLFRKARELYFEFARKCTRPRS